jgi:hypothetical protein
VECGDTSPLWEARHVAPPESAIIAGALQREFLSSHGQENSLKLGPLRQAVLLPMGGFSLKAKILLCTLRSPFSVLSQRIVILLIILMVLSACSGNGIGTESSRANCLQKHRLCCKPRPVV